MSPLLKKAEGRTTRWRSEDRIEISAESREKEITLFHFHTERNREGVRTFCYETCVHCKVKS